MVCEEMNLRLQEEIDDIKRLKNEADLIYKLRREGWEKRKHGRWIYIDRQRKAYRQYSGIDAAGETHTIMVLEKSKGKEPYCSECGAQAAESFMNFCPRCGAKMDGEGLEDGKTGERLEGAASASE